MKNFDFYEEMDYIMEQEMAAAKQRERDHKIAMKEMNRINMIERGGFDE